MRDWIAAAVVFFCYIAVVAPMVRGLSARRRLLAVGGAVTGLVVSAAAHWQPYQRILHDWLLPPLLLLLAYWASGLLFAAPMERAERAFVDLDDALRIDALAAATPRWLAELLEV